MTKTTKATRAAEAALDAAAEAAKDAKRLSKTLPNKDAKKLRSLADEAKDASRVSKKRVARNPKKVEKKAVAAIARVEKAADKAEDKLAAARAAAIKKRTDAAKKDAKKVAKKGRTVSKTEAPRGPAVLAADDALVESPPTDTPPSVEPAPTPAASEDLLSLTVVQLRDRARSAGHTGFSRFTKAQLIALLSS